MNIKNPSEPSEALKERLATLPEEPGVYLMKDGRGQIIYIGKARSLRNRVRTYFNRNRDVKTLHLQARIRDIEIIVTQNEMEALLLENNLIKRYRPRYNINLKDGKTYPVIKLTNEEYPRVYRTRRIVFDGSEYFGPYPNVQQIDTYLNLIDRLFPLRKCRGPLKERSHPCLNYYIGRCAGVCAGKMSREEYLERVEKVRRLLSGETGDLAQELARQMQEAAANREYEKAGRFRDQLQAVQMFSEEQKVVDFVDEDRDYLGLHVRDFQVSATLLQMRNGRLVGREVFQFEDYSGEQEILMHFLAQYYANTDPLPRHIYLSAPEADGQGPDDEALIERFLLEITGREIGVHRPREGKDARMVQMAVETSRERVEGSAVNQQAALQALQEALGLPAPPRRIEGFDIAHLGGEQTVASMVVFSDGLPERKSYRRFRIRTLQGRIDDFEAIREVVARRYTRLVNEEQTQPSLVLIDGGKGQLSAARGILRRLGLESLPVAGLAKQQEEIFLPDRREPVRLAEGSAALRLLQAVRDESHRFATTYHKRLRDGKVRRSLLEEVAGIGPKRSRTLLTRYGSIDAILAAPAAEVAALLKVSPEQAARLLEEVRRRGG